MVRVEHVPEQLSPPAGYRFVAVDVARHRLVDIEHLVRTEGDSVGKLKSSVEEPALTTPKVVAAHTAVEVK